jgi:hypothetical protein
MTKQEINELIVLGEQIIKIASVKKALPPDATIQTGFAKLYKHSLENLQEEFDKLVPQPDSKIKSNHKIETSSTKNDAIKSTSTVPTAGVKRTTIKAKK